MANKIFLGLNYSFYTGAFITEYTGEVLTKILADSRKKNPGSHFYMFNMLKKNNKEKQKVNYYFFLI